MEEKIKELFKEYETETICVSDFGLSAICRKGIIVFSTQVDYIHLTENGKVELWAGNPDTDKYAEELFPENKEEILEKIYNNL